MPPRRRIACTPPPCDPPLHPYDEDTIAAIATPLGEGGISIIRLSGAQSIALVQRLFRSASRRDLRQVPTQTIHRGNIVHPETQEVLDETLVTVMRAPHSYTREDVVEINCHGGVFAVRKILDVLLACGVRLAAPGEFTKRAFLNGRIDLAQAESVIDVIRAKTDAGLRLALQQLRGRLSQRVTEMHRQLKHMLVIIEATLDFPEDDVEIVAHHQVIAGLEQMLSQLHDVLAHAQEGRMVRDGVSVAIVGKPNVGKSSLLNVLLEEERAIVTPIPGTTRDTIEEYITLHGVPFHLIDTAGLRHTTDAVEQLGVARSRKALEDADLVLCLFDASVPWSDEDQQIAVSTVSKTRFGLLNKIDLPPLLSTAELRQRLPQPTPIFQMSLTEQRGISELKQALVEHVLTVPLESVEVTSSRHKQALTLAARSLEHARQAVETNMPSEIVAIDLKEALHDLGMITGETTTEDILDEIFSTFCIGK